MGVKTPIVPYDGAWVVRARDGASPLRDGKEGVHVSSSPALPRFPFDTPPSLDHEPEHARLRAEGPLVRARLADGTEVWVATGHAACRAVLADPRFSRAAGSAPGAPTITPGITANPENMLNMDAPEHARLRRLVAGVFTSRVVEQRRPRVQEITDRLLDDMVAHGPPADLVELVAMPLPITVVCDLLGMPYEDVEPIRHWSEVTQSVGAYSVEEIMAAVGDFEAYLAGLIATKHHHPGDDLVTRLIEARDQDDRLNDVELLQMIAGVIIAGHETTSSLLPLALLTLFRHPEQLALLRSRPDLVPTAVDELLRFTRLLPAAFSRTATEDVEVEGVTVPAGDTVFPLLYSANRDAAVYAEPDRLDVARQGPPHLTFGLGPHVCLGAPLARVELQVAIASLLCRFPSLELAMPEDELEWRAGRFIRGVRAFPLRW